MKQNKEKEKWEQFYRSGSINDYIAYRQFVSRSNTEQQGGFGEVTSSAADHRGDRNKGTSFR